MTSSPGDLNALARRVLLLEAEGSRDPAVLSSALEATYEKLLGELARIVGVGGAAALARRALAQARRDFPCLEEVRPDPDGSTRLLGVKDALDRADRHEREAAAVAAIERLLQLLVTLLGSNLGLRSVRTTWPTAARERDDASTEGDP